MKLKILILLLIAATALLALSQVKSKPFTPAGDFPREALIYVQVADLPALIKLWNASKTNEKYTNSKNYEDFLRGHLGLKILSRWKEFDAAAGFPVDLETVAKLANDQAAIAVYDIGKFEFVFVAPISEEIFAATKFVRNEDKFSEETLKDGTTIYRAAVEADRGRQKQELIFTNVRGRFILATSEKLLMQTLHNINGSGGKNRLIDAPEFKVLSEKIAPHTATVWINQTALNDDYYFKHYWLMSDVKNLKNFRAGIFDFAIEAEKLTETRRFLLNETENVAPVGNDQTGEILALLPADIPFYQLRKANDETLDKTIEQTIFDRRSTEEIAERQSYFSTDDDYTSSDYDVLGGKFDEAIDDFEETETIRKAAMTTDFSMLFQTAAPQAVLTFTSPQVLPAPRFIEFRRAVVVNLGAPDNFNHTAFEAAIERKIAAQILIASPNVELNWETKNENETSRRELALPMLGQTISYVVRGSALILTDHTDFLREILTGAKTEFVKTSEKPFAELTVINLDQKEAAYDRVFGELARQKAANEFFTGNISSLLDSISEVKKIEIKRNYSPNNLEEELTFFFQ